MDCWVRGWQVFSFTLSDYVHKQWKQFPVPTVSILKNAPVPVSSSAVDVMANQLSDLSWLCRPFGIVIKDFNEAELPSLSLPQRDFSFPINSAGISAAWFLNSQVLRLAMAVVPMRNTMECSQGL